MIRFCRKHTRSSVVSILFISNTGLAHSKNTVFNPDVQISTVRIQTDGDYEWRTDLYDRTANRLGEGTRSGGIDGACEFTQQMLDNLEEAADHPDMTEELAEVLSTARVKTEYRVETGVVVD